MELANVSVSERAVSEHGEARAGCHFRQYVSGNAILSIDTHLSRLFDHQLDTQAWQG
jgi:hypothetical protein